MMGIEFLILKADSSVLDDIRHVLKRNNSAFFFTVHLVKEVVTGAVIYFGRLDNNTLIDLSWVGEVFGYPSKNRADRDKTYQKSKKTDTEQGPPDLAFWLFQARNSASFAKKCHRKIDTVSLLYTIKKGKREADSLTRKRRDLISAEKVFET